MKVKVILGNRDAYLEQPYPYEDLLPFFSFSPPGAKFTPAFRYRGWDGKIKLLHPTSGLCPAGLFRALQPTIKEKLGIVFKVTTDQQPVYFKNIPQPESDRDFQNQCVLKMAEAAEQGGGLIINATGTGKTYVAGKFFKWLQGEGIFVVDELTLLDQARKEISKVMGEEVGYVGNSVFDPKRITVATVQTLHRHRQTRPFQKWTQRTEVIMVDEVHSQLNRRNFDVVSNIRPPAVFGLTATLELGKKHIRTKAYSLAGPVIFEYPLAQGVAESYLTNGVVIQPLIENYRGKKESGKGLVGYANDYSDLVVTADFRNKVIIGIAKAAYDRDKFTVILVERVSHLKYISEKLKKIPHRVVYGNVKVEDRIIAKQKFDKGRVRLIIANKVFKKGVDIKRIDAIIDAAAMKSSNDAIQKFGRGVRLYKGKKGLIYFDIGDAENRFEAAAKRRRRAFKKAGIAVKRFGPYEQAADTNITAETENWFQAAERMLKRAEKEKESKAKNSHQITK